MYTHRHTHTHTRTISICKWGSLSFPLGARSWLSTGSKQLTSASWQNPHGDPFSAEHVLTPHHSLCLSVSLQNYLYAPKHLLSCCLLREQTTYLTNRCVRACVCLPVRQVSEQLALLNSRVSVSGITPREKKLPFHCQKISASLTISITSAHGLNVHHTQGNWSNKMWISWVC